MMPPLQNDFGLPINTPRLRLRRFASTDADVLRAYRNDPVVARFQGWSSLTQQEAAIFAGEMAMVPCGAPGVGIQIAVALWETDALIGDCYLKVSTDAPWQAEIGFTVARQHQGNGYAAEAVSAVLGMCFGDLGLHRVMAVTDVRNGRSVRLLTKLGFRREAHFRESWREKDGGWSDEYLYALLESEWRARLSNPR
jgi:RimJ/RimL family protein N-acetyltransferase